MKEEFLEKYDYQNKQLIGSGSNGSRVYKILCKTDNKYYALKKIFVSNKNKNQYLTETSILKKISHPNIIQYYDSFIKDDKLYLILEYAKDGDLRHIINEHKENKKPFTESEILIYLLQLVDSIEYIHGKKILHRDIKPENIFLSDNKIKLGDFGISKELTTSIDFTDTGVGTPYYISPEICNGKKYNYKTDIWSLGCLIYELLTLTRPFNGESLNALMLNIINNKPEINIPNIYDNNFTSLVEKSMDKNFELRPDIREIKNILLNIKFNNENKLLKIDNINSNSHNNSTVYTCNTTTNSHKNKSISSAKYRQKNKFDIKDKIFKNINCEQSQPLFDNKSKSKSKLISQINNFKVGYITNNQKKAIKINLQKNDKIIIRRNDNNLINNNININNKNVNNNDFLKGKMLHLSNKTVLSVKLNFKNIKPPKIEQNNIIKRAESLNQNIKDNNTNIINNKQILVNINQKDQISKSNFKKKLEKSNSIDQLISRKYFIKKRIVLNERNEATINKNNFNPITRKEVMKKFLIDKLNKDKVNDIENILINNKMKYDEKKSLIINQIG